MTEENKIHWLPRRLKEVGKTKVGLAKELGINQARLSDLENGEWRFQVSHVKKAAEYLEFDRTAFLDFLSGDITEDELWHSEKPLKISDEDIRLLSAIRDIIPRQAREETPDVVENSSQPAKIPPTNNGRSR
ncbi:MAG: helix-turn-helix transcriptional regulator [Selenomonadaceae bacterium]|nr:helix-turn-helix transcriptional regulator [Selenomonadaceae bacterium]